MGGMIAGKDGAVQFHMGVGKAGLSMLFRLLEETEIPAHHLQRSASVRIEVFQQTGSP